MKKKINNKIAFTFVELLVSIFIISILAISSVFYFGDFIATLNINSKVEVLKEEILLLDSKVSNKEIFDYKVVLLKDKNYYLVYENTILDSVNIIFDSLNNNIGKIVFFGGNSGTGIIKFYKGYKFQKLKVLGYNKFLTGSFQDRKIYKFYGTFSGRVINNLFFHYYSDDKNYDVIYRGNNLELKNILGKKNYSDLELEFEDSNGKKEKFKVY